MDLLLVTVPDGVDMVMAGRLARLAQLSSAGRVTL